MTDWIEDTVSGLQAQGILRVEDGNHGEYRPRPDEFSTEGVTFVRAADLIEGVVSFATASKINEIARARITKGIGKPGDVLISHKGTVGKIARAPADAPQFVCSPQTTFWRSTNENVLNQDFLFVLMRSPAFIREFFVTAGETDMAGYVSLTSQRRLKLTIPPIAVQRGISSCISAFDDKIELNRKMNGTLEAMARALFRDWFVDFGPTRAKMEGRPAYLSEDLWSLFPDRLDEEGKPVGWEVSNLAAILSVLETGRRPKGGVAGISSGVPSVGAESIDGVGKFDFAKTKYVSHEFFAKMAKGHVSEGDVLIYKDGGKPGELRPSVSYASKGFPFQRFCINEHVFRARSDRVDQAFLYCLLSTHEAFAQMRELATGVAQPGLNQAQMGRLSFVLPEDQQLLDHAASILKTLVDACNVNANESRTLAQTRDLLLPRLMSGELQPIELICT